MLFTNFLKWRKSLGPNYVVQCVVQSFPQKERSFLQTTNYWMIGKKHEIVQRTTLTTVMIDLSQTCLNEAKILSYYDVWVIFFEDHLSVANRISTRSVSYDFVQQVAFYRFLNINLEHWNKMLEYRHTVHMNKVTSVNYMASYLLRYAVLLTLLGMIFTLKY